MDLIVLGKDRKIRLFPSMRRPMAAIELVLPPIGLWPVEEAERLVRRAQGGEGAA